MENWNLELDDGIAVLAYTSPQRALSFAIMTELADLLESFAGSARYVSVVLLTGGDTQYLPDADYEEIQRLTEPGPIVGDALAWHRVTSALGSLPQPTVAAIDGNAAGGACLIALACTFRVASERATLGSVRLNVGLVGSDSSSYLVPLVGPAVAADLLMTGRSLQASEAKQAGLVNAVFPTDGFSDHVREWCHGIARNPPELLLAIKQAVAQRAVMSCDEDPVFGARGLQKSPARTGCGC
jgi:enoyl-CoA hydratase/carnithine racemase